MPDLNVAKCMITVTLLNLMRKPGLPFRQEIWPPLASSMSQIDITLKCATRCCKVVQLPVASIARVTLNSLSLLVLAVLHLVTWPPPRTGLPPPYISEREFSAGK